MATLKSKGARRRSEPRPTGHKSVSPPVTPQPSSPLHETPAAVGSSAHQSLSKAMPAPKNMTAPLPVYAFGECGEYASGPAFEATKSEGNLYAIDRSTVLNVDMRSTFVRGFFLSNKEWTSYRRNYFQVNSTFFLSGFPDYYDHQNEMECLVRDMSQGLHAVKGFVMGISARVSDGSKDIPLMQHTPKRDKGPISAPARKLVRPGGNPSLLGSTFATNSAVNGDPSIVTFERIQFKTATANNGKRRAAQQYYVVVMELYAKTDGGHHIRVAIQESSPVVVRGRSPGHYGDERRVSYGTTTSSHTSAAATDDNDRLASSLNVPFSQYRLAPLESPLLEASYQLTPAVPPVPEDLTTYFGSSFQTANNTLEMLPFPHQVIRGAHDRSMSAPSHPPLRPPEPGHQRMASTGDSAPPPSFMNACYYPFTNPPQSQAVSSSNCMPRPVDASPQSPHTRASSRTPSPSPSAATTSPVQPSLSVPMNDAHCPSPQQSAASQTSTTPARRD